MSKGYRDLRVWKQAIELAEAVYTFAEQLPHTETWNLVDQMKRASVSVPSNIAEGQASGSDKVFSRHLRIALGSLAELDTHLVLVKRLEIAAIEVPTSMRRLISDTRSGLHRLLEYLAD